jgi:hypothetical protein
LATPRRSHRIATKRKTVAIPVRSEVGDMAGRRLLGKNNLVQIQEIEFWFCVITKIALFSLQ